MRIRVRVKIRESVRADMSECKYSEGMVNDMSEVSFEDTSDGSFEDTSEGSGEPYE